MRIFNYANYSQGLGLPEISQNILTKLLLDNYSNWTKAKSLVGIRTPFYHKAHRRQQFNIAGFFMRTISTPLVISLGKFYQYYGGLVEGTPVRRFLMSGSSNLDQLTTSRFEPLGGGLQNYHKEAVIMTTTPNTKPSKIYTFAIGKPQALHATFKRIRTVSTLAQSESQARANLSGLRLTLIKCVPVSAQEVAA
ncbi:MAG TPA: hypothetical protein DEV85_06185 [Vibrio sp.]|uniref:hypothetical protein n=1 Tax=Vibrio sp. TaxID=678 RepID=UPI000ED248B3|nr:hypothetical protein [Vibrio sp.]HCH01461.1 hypothetical protein [Vibrio sp.]